MLQPQDIAALVQTLVYDGRVQLDPQSQDEESFRPARVPPPEKSAFSAVPCGVCPVHLPVYLLLVQSWECKQVSMCGAADTGRA